MVSIPQGSTVAAAQAIVDANPAGTTYTFLQGTTRDFGTGTAIGLILKLTDIFEGEVDGGGNNLTIILGSELLAGWSSIGGGNWEVTGVTNRSDQHQVQGGEAWAQGMQSEEEDLFKDGDTLLQVPTEGEVTDGPFLAPGGTGHSYAGTWYFDKAHASGGRIVIGFDPSGIDVTLSHESTALDTLAGGIEVRNLILGEYSSRWQKSPLRNDDGDGNWWHDVEVYGVHGTGLRTGANGLYEDLLIRDIGQLGWGGGGGSNTEYGHIEMTECNLAGYSSGNEAGGNKIAVASDVWFHDIYAHDCRGPGFWLDIDNLRHLVELSFFKDNQHRGFSHEIGFECEVRYCVAEGNGIAFTTWGWGAQMLIQNSQDTWIHHCRALTLGSGTDGIVMISQRSRGASSRHVGSTGIAQFITINSTVEDCIIESPANSGYFAARLQDGPDLGFPEICEIAGNNVYGRNKYYAPAGWLTGNRFACALNANWTDWLALPLTGVGSTAFENAWPGPTGSISGTILSATEESNIVAGGKVLTITLDEGEFWNSRVGQDNVETAALIAHITGNPTEPNGWDNEVTPLLDHTHFTRVDQSTVTLALPAVAGYVLALAEQVTVVAPFEALVGGEDVSAGIFDIALTTAGQPSVALTGTITTANEQDIVDGGKTIILSVSNDTLVAAGTPFDDARDDLIALLISRASETFGWNAEVIAALSPGDVVRTDATTVTVTLPNVPNYNITINEIVDTAVPAAMLTTSIIDVPADPPITVTTLDPRSASVNTTSLLDSELVAGTVAFVLTLTSDAWVASGGTFDAQRQNIIDGFVADLNEDGGFNRTVRPGIAITDVTRLNAQQVNVVVPAATTYSIRNPETITITVSATAVDGGGAIVVDETVALRFVPKAPAVPIG